MTTSSPAVSGATIGTAVATNSPTGWSIIAGDPNGNFAISNAGVITYASHAPTDFDGAFPFQTAGLTVQASNGAGSGSATITINIWADGALSAPVIAAGAQFPTVLNGYGGFSARRFDQPTWQPPWKVAGVDYPVGINDAAKPLKNVLTQTLPSGVSRSGNSVTITGNNVTMDGWDFSVSGGVSLVVNGSNAIIQNCLWVAGAGLGSDLAVLFNGPGGLLQYCEFDGNSATTSSQCVALENTTGTCTVQYNYIHNWNDDALRLQNDVTGTTPANVQWYIRWNACFSGGYSGVHFDFLQTVTASYNLIDYGFNFVEQPAAVGGVPTEATFFRNSDFGVGGVGTYVGQNSNVHHSVCIGLGTGASMAFSQSLVFAGTGGTASSSNDNSTAHDLYFDFHGNQGPSFDGQIFSSAGQATNVTQYGIWDMTRLSATNGNAGYVTNQQVSSSLGFAQPPRPAVPTSVTAVKSGSNVAVTGTAPASNGIAGGYYVNVYAVDLPWPACLLNPGPTMNSVAASAGFSFTTTKALPAGTHSIQVFVVDQNWNASPMSAIIQVTI
jgi:hypothetical protein